LGEAATRVLTPHSEYLRLGDGTQERQKVYAGLFGSTADNERLEEIRAATNGGYALGDELFRKTMSRALGRRVDKGKPGRPPAENVVCP